MSDHLIDYIPVFEVIASITNDLYSSNKSFGWVVVEGINITLPILYVESNHFDDFVFGRCGGDLKTAQNRHLWMAHVLTLCIMQINEVLEALSRGGHINIYSENVCMQALYRACLVTNPHMKYEDIKWPKELEEKKKKDLVLKPEHEETARGIISSLDLLEWAWKSKIKIGRIDSDIASLINKIERMFPVEAEGK